MNGRQPTDPRFGPAPRNVVRKVAPVAPPALDESWWPVTLLLLVSASALAGYIWTSGDFQTQVFYRNAWFHLAIVGGVALTLVVGVAMLRGGSQRRLQLGIFLSLAFHVGLIFLSRQLYMKFKEPERKPLAGSDDADAVPDYLPLRVPQNSKVAELTRPAEADVRPERQLAVVQQPREQPQAEKETIEEPDPRVVPQPATIEPNRVEVAAPRRSEALSGLQLARKDLPDEVRTEAARLIKPAQIQESRAEMTARSILAERQTLDSTPQSRLEVNLPREQQRPQTEPGQAAPRQQQLPDQMASIDFSRTQSRRALEQAAVPETMPDLGQPATQAMPRADTSPLPSSAADTARQAPDTAANRPAMASPTDAQFLPSNRSAAGAPARAESPMAADLPSNSIHPAPPSRFAANQLAAVGFDQPSIDLPSSPASGSAGASPDSPTESQATSLARGDQGLPRDAAMANVGETVPLGQGSGLSPGSSFAGPQRKANVGEGNEGSANASGTTGRSGRGPGRGAASPLASLPGEMAPSFAGPSVRSGNASAGQAQNASPSNSSPGAAIVDRATVLPGGAMSRPNVAGATPGAGLSGTTGPGTTTAGGSAIGPRRELGESAGSAIGGVEGGTGVAARGKIGRGAGPALLEGDGPAPQTGSPAGRPNVAEVGGAPSIEPAVDTGGMRRAANGPAVAINAPQGVGGLTLAMRPEAGLPSTLSRAESDTATPDVNRFPDRPTARKGGGSVRVDSVPAYKQRDPEGRGEIAKLHGGTEDGEKAVERGLDFLARHQSPDGSWKLHDFGNGRPGYENAGLAAMESNTAGTGLALLAFLGAGYTHRDLKYDTVVRNGLDYLLRNQKPDGDLFVRPPGAEQPNTWLYSHGIATIALCEAYGMTRDEALLRVPAQKAVDFIVEAQDPNYGGWRYLPRLGSDTSVSGWQLMALKSGERVGLTVPARTYTMVNRWLDFSQGAGNDPTRYAYRPQAKPDGGEDVEHQIRPSRVMTAEALLMRQYLGWNRDHPYLVGGADYLLTELPQLGTAAAGERDSYYWYYGTQVMFHMKGEHWRQWNDRLQPLLVNSQLQQGALAGSWDPAGEIPDRWGGSGGRIYVTAMNLLMLEVYYRYLPLYQTLD